MTLILETGNGVQDANSYVTTAYIDNYLSNRSRSTENSWDSATTAQKEAAAIKATQYIDHRFGQRFKGTIATYFDGTSAEAIAEFAGQPNDGETITVGDYTYTFKTTLSTLTSDNEVLIGGDTATTVANLVAALSGGTNTHIIANQNASAEVDATTNTQINLTASQEGESGNDITLSTTSANITLTGFVNGRDYGSQRLAFPRSSLYDQAGVEVIGIPRNLKWAVCEYAIRAHAKELFQDPSVDASGRAVTEETVGPITTKYADGGSLDLLIRPYPAADYMLKGYIVPAGVYR